MAQRRAGLAEGHTASQDKKPSLWPPSLHVSKKTEKEQVILKIHQYSRRNFKMIFFLSSLFLSDLCKIFYNDHLSFSIQGGGGEGN